jgi:hypothetical protein
MISDLNGNRSEPRGSRRDCGDEERNLVFWAQMLNVTREELRSALEDLGPIAPVREPRTGT